MAPVGGRLVLFPSRDLLHEVRGRRELGPSCDDVCVLELVLMMRLCCVCDCVGASEQRGAVGPVHLDPGGGPGEAGPAPGRRHHLGRRRVGSASAGLRSGRWRRDGGAAVGGFSPSLSGQVSKYCCVAPLIACLCGASGLLIPVVTSACLWGSCRLSNHEVTDHNTLSEVKTGCRLPLAGFGGVNALYFLSYGHLEGVPSIF